jgi:hypothetical protein
VNRHHRVMVTILHADTSLCHQCDSTLTGLIAHVASQFIMPVYTSLEMGYTCSCHRIIRNKAWDEMHMGKQDITITAEPSHRSIKLFYTLMYVACLMSN